MKSNYVKSSADARKIAREEIEVQKATVCPACERSIGNQVVAIMCKALHLRFGFGKDRLNALLREAQDLFVLCGNDRRFNALQAVEWLRNDMQIDLESGIETR